MSAARPHLAFVALVAAIASWPGVSAAEEVAGERPRAVELAVGPHASYQPYNGADDGTWGGWASALVRVGLRPWEVSVGARGAYGVMNDVLSEAEFRTRIVTGAALARALRCRGSTCLGVGIELGAAWVSRIATVDTTTRVKGFVGVPLSLELGSRRPLSFVLEAGPRLRLGTDFGGQTSGDGGYKSPIGLFVGLGVAYAFAL